MRLQNSALDMVEHGLAYMKACVIKDPTNYKKPVGDVFVHQVGDAKAEREEWRRPEDVKVRSFAAAQRCICTLIVSLARVCGLSAMRRASKHQAGMLQKWRSVVHDAVSMSVAASHCA